MRLRFFALSVVILNASILFAQDTGYFSEVIDLGYGGNNTRFSWVEKGSDDLLYVFGNNISENGYLTSQITKLNGEGEILDTREFQIAPGASHNFKVFNDTLYVLDVVDRNSSFQYRITRIDTQLNLIDENTYYFDSIVHFYADSDLTINEKQIAFVGWVNKPNTNSGIVAFINRMTMLLDTSFNEIIGPYDDLQTNYSCNFNINGSLNVFFSAKTDFDSPGIHNHFGVIQINSDYEIFVNDFNAFSEGSGPTLSIFNENRLTYKGRSPDHGPLTYRHVNIDINIDTIWIVDDTPGSYRGNTYFLGYFQKAESTFAFGEREWHFGYNGTDFPPPDSVSNYQTAYLLKIDNSTGTKKWGRTFIEFNEFGKVRTYVILGMTVLEKGDLFCVGALVEKDENEVRTAVKPWIMRLPPDGCYLGSCDGMESFLSSSDDLTDVSEAAITVFPNPVGNVLNIKNLINTNYRELRYTVSDISGRQIKNAKLQLSTSGTIDFSALARGVYFLNIIDKKQKETYTFKIVKE